MRYLFVLLALMGSAGCLKKKLIAGVVETSANRAGQNVSLRAIVPVTSPAKAHPKQFTVTLFGDTAKPEGAIFRLLSIGSANLELGCNDLTLSAGGEALSIGLVAREHFVRISGSAAIQEETLIAFLRAEDMVRVASAEAVTGVACDVPFSFNDSQLSKLKDFVAQVGFGKSPAAPESAPAAP